MVALFLDDNKTNDDGDGKERQKSKRFLLVDKTTNLHVHHAILYISLPSLHPCDMKLPNFTRLLYGVGENNTKVVFFLSWT